jgi:hypothetical protein
MLSHILVSVLALIAAVSALPLAKRGTGASIQVLSESEFCFYVPSVYGGNIGVYEDNSTPACTNTSLAPGSLLFAPGFIQSAHYASSGSYSQVTGRIDRSLVWSRLLFGCYSLISSLRLTFCCYSMVYMHPTEVVKWTTWTCLTVHAMVTNILSI